MPETLVLSVLRGRDVTYVATVPGQRVAMRYDVGMSLPAAFTASGQAILSTMPNDSRARDRGDLVESDQVAAGPKTINRLLSQLRETTTRGYAIDDEETALGMRCFGVPVGQAANGIAEGAIAISMVKHAHDASAADRIQEMGRRVNERLR